MNQAVSMCSLLLFFLQTNKPCSSFSFRMNPLKMSAIPPENASAAARRQPESNQLVTNKMCPFAQKAWIALEYSGIPYSTKEIGLYGPDGKPSWFLEMNPEGTVPVLSCYGGAVIIPDSESILEYIQQGGLDGPNGNKLKLSADDSRLVKSNAWRSFISKELCPIGKSSVLGSKKALKELKTMLAEKGKDIVGPFLCGDSVTVADCALFPFIWRLNSEIGFANIKGCEEWEKWLSRCESEPAFQKTIQSSWWWWW